MKRKSKKKQSRKYKESDSSSNSDDAPLVKLHRSPINSLFKYSIEKCEFCDKIFYNKYNMLVHNAKHIIIPLVNQKLHKCSQCRRHFPSIESLEWHSINSHSYISDNKDYLPKILQSFVKREPIMVLTKEPLFSNDSNTVNGDNDELTNYKEENVSEILQSLVKKEPVTMLTKLEDPLIADNKKLLESFIKREPITLLKKETFHIDNDEGDSDAITIFDSDDEDSVDIKVKTEIEYEYIGVESESENTSNPKIKDRIKFEEEDECLEFQNILNVPGNRRKNAIILGNKPNVTENTEWCSVHNDELTRPGMFKCKKCAKNFPTRYEAIIHETSHLRIKSRLPLLCRYCDWYVAIGPTALQAHKRTKHPEPASCWERKPLQKCKECKLSYIDWKRHRQNYHYEYLCDCGEVFLSREERSKHKLEHTANEVEGKSGPEIVKWLISTVKVCEFCYQWFRDKSNLKYQHVKFYFKLGERCPCERCGKWFFELRVVRIRYKKYKKDPFKVVEKEVFDMRRNGRKPITNTDRLKNVQQRLKNLKKLNKF